MMHTKANKDEGQVFKWGVRDERMKAYFENLNAK